MALTDAQILKFRKLTGDTDINDYSATNDEIDAYYTLASAEVTANDALSVEPLTIVYLFQQRMSWAQNQTDETGEFGNRRNSQIFDKIHDDLLPYWRDLAGLAADSGSGAGMTVGVLLLGTDVTEDDL